MARINIEDSLFSDTRFIALQIKLGSSELAIGSLVVAWKVAQSYWKDSDNGIPRPAWERHKLNNLIIEVGLAEDRGEFIFMVGSEKNFRWLRESQKSGVASGVARRVKRNHKGISRTEPNGRQPLPLTPTLTLNKKETKGELSTESIAPFIGSYVAAFQKRYGPDARPMLDGKAVGLAKTIVRDVGLAKAVELVQVFLQLDDPWFLKKTYDLSTFRENLNKVSLAATTGRVPDGTPESGDQWKKRMLEKLEG